MTRQGVDISLFGDFGDGRKVILCKCHNHYVKFQRLHYDFQLILLCMNGIFVEVALYLSHCCVVVCLLCIMHVCDMDKIPGVPDSPCSRVPQKKSILFWGYLMDALNLLFSGRPRRIAPSIPQTTIGQVSAY